MVRTFGTVRETMLYRQERQAYSIVTMYVPHHFLSQLPTSKSPCMYYTLQQSILSPEHQEITRYQKTISSACQPTYSSSSTFSTSTAISLFEIHMPIPFSPRFASSSSSSLLFSCDPNKLQRSTVLCNPRTHSHGIRGSRLS